MTSEKLMDQKEAAEKLGLSQKTLEKWRSVGRPALRYVRLGSAIKYRLQDIEAFIASSVVGDAQPKGRRKNRAA